MVIREFTQNDLKEILEIEKQSFLVPWSSTMFAALHRINPKGFYIVEMEHKVIAYAILLIEPYLVGTGPDTRAHLINLAVDPEFRRRGVGRYLMDAIQIDIRISKVRKIFLEVRKSNKEAQGFYSKLLFKRVGSIKDFYMDEDAIIMTKDMN
jgi:ribosomal-protein-alanine N-acetyltransferase